MKIVTEIYLREKYKKEPFESLTLNPEEKLTPSAKEFLIERKIQIVTESEKNTKVNKNKNILKVEPEKGYLLLDSGEIVEGKPEAYTHLKGRILVPKNNKRIVFRGKLDNLEAMIINTILNLQGIANEGLLEDLNIIFEYCKRMMRAEVLEEKLEFIDFHNLNDEEVRQRSHYPDKYFGVKHFTPSVKNGRIVAELNIIRTLIRQLEIAAVDAFYDEDKKTIDREDIIIALNRMSSLIYIIMCQHIGGIYK